MGKFRFGKKSLAELATVDPDWTLVATRALELSDTDFGIGKGCRSQAEQDELYTHGRTTAEVRKAGILNLEGKPHLQKVTWTRNSKHTSRLAIDILVYIDGKLTWEEKYYDHVAQFFIKASQELGIPIEWGGNWDKSKDRPHYELVKKHRKSV